MNVKVFNVGNKALPKYETALSAGVDVRADFSRNDLDHPIKVFGSGQFVPANEVQKTSCLYLDPMSRALIPTGLHVAIPEGYEVRVQPRSGLALKEGITVLNTPGCVDSDYRGEIGVILINLSNKVVCIEDDERIGQLILDKFERIDWEVVDSINALGETERFGGFGSTNKK